MNTLKHRCPIKTVLIVILLLVGVLAITGYYVQRRMTAQRLDMALAQAVTQNDLAAARAALDHGADADARRIGQGSITFWSAFLALFDRSKNVPDFNRMTPLGEAAGTLSTETTTDGSKPPPEHLEMMKLLLDHGANINAGGGFSPLWSATSTARTESVKFLLDHGASLAKVGKGRMIPIFWAFAPASGGRPEIVKAMLDHGADANTRAEDRATPLMAAVLTQTPESVKLLLDHGADVNARDNAGHTALSLVLTDQSKYADGFYQQNAKRTMGQIQGKAAQSFRAWDQRAYNTDAKIITMLKQAGAKP